MKYPLKISALIAGVFFVFAPALAFASFDTNLQAGSRGGAVVSLQQFLISQNLLSPDSATGFFGKLTQKAIVAFQSKQSIVPASGLFGPLTRAKANSLATITASVPATTTANGLSCAFQDPLVPDAPASWQDGKQVYFPSLTKWAVMQERSVGSAAFTHVRSSSCVRRGDPYSDFLGCNSWPLVPPTGYRCGRWVCIYH